jgi:oligopeptide/dipeptide ABC transporter ATP-binding protein
MTEPLLEVTDLTVKYETKNNDVTAVSNASFEVERGEYFGLVGESGCGKTTLIKSILGGLDNNGYIDSGTIRFNGEEIQDFSDRQLNEEIRWKEVAWIPQGSMSSLDPLQRVDEQAAEIAGVHTDMSEEELKERLRELFDVVGLQESRISDYPHQFSGGMEQRALIAFALLLNPALLVADEPTTALDVIMQDQVFKYLDEIRGTQETSMILVTHDISVVFESCDQVAIMHAGQVAERGSVTDVYNNPRHPYSILLQEAFPDVRYPDRELEIIEGAPPQNLDEVDYCTFTDRCPWAVSECEAKAPPSQPVPGDEKHAAACIRSDEVLEMYREDDTRQTAERDTI